MATTPLVPAKLCHGRYDENESWDSYLKKGGDPKPTKKVANDPHSRAGGIVWGVLDAKDEEMNDYKTASHAVELLK